MRTLCDVCESAAATLFCAADEAALCRACDDKVHTCNKLASRHIRVGLAELSEVPRCDICENAPGGKRTHRRYLLLRQRVEFPGNDKPGSREELGSQKGRLREKENLQNHRFSPNSFIGNSSESDEKMEDFLIDLNARPPGLYDRAANNQEQVDTLVDINHASQTMVPNRYFREEPEK